MVGRTGEQCRDRWRKIGLGDARRVGEWRHCIFQCCCCVQRYYKLLPCEDKLPATFLERCIEAGALPFAGTWSDDERQRLKVLVQDYLLLLLSSPFLPPTNSHAPV